MRWLCFSIDYDKQVSKVTLKNPTYYASSEYGNYVGKYVSLNADGSEPVYYVTAATYKGSSASITYFDLTTNPVLSFITRMEACEYVYGESIDTFPNGLSNNYYYEYKGIIEENILNGFKAPWETIYSGVVDLDTTGSSLESKTAQHKFDDYEIASDYSVFRVVIKKGASFYCKAGSSTDGNYVGFAKTTVSTIGGELITVQASPDGESSAYVTNEYQFVLDEDIISKDIVKNDVINRNIRISDGASSSQNFTDTKSANLWLTAIASKPAVHPYSDVAKMSFTFEIQGRRD